MFKSFFFKLGSGLIVGLSVGILVLAFNNPTGNPTIGGGVIGVGSGAPASSIYINSSGNVGIGTAGPGYKLDIQTPNNYDQLRVRSTGASGEPLIKLSGGYNSGNGAELWQDISGAFRINTNSMTTGLFITATGKVGIGVASGIPSELLSVGNNAFTVSSAGSITAGTWNATTIATGRGGTGATAAANAANGVVVLNASAQLPAVSGALLTNLPVSNIPSNIQVFTSSGTWTKPAGISTVYVKVWGGGGAGGSYSPYVYSSPGGGGGGYSEGLIAVNGNVTVTVGTGGVFGAGGTSSFLGLSAGGGAVGGAGGTGSGGTVNLTGQNGSPGRSTTVGGTNYYGGIGGQAPLGGAGGAGGIGGGSGFVGAVPGGAGGGGVMGGNGGDGATGMVIVYY